MYLQQIAGYRESSPHTLFQKLLPAYGHRQSADLAVPFLQVWMISPNSENNMDSSYRGLTPALVTSCLLLMPAPCFPRLSSTPALLLKQLQPCSSGLSLNEGEHCHFRQPQVLWAPRKHFPGLGVSSVAEGTGRRPVRELATIQGQQPAPLTSLSGYRLCPISSGLGPGEGNLLTVPLTG